MPKRLILEFKFRFFPSIQASPLESPLQSLLEGQVLGMHAVFQTARDGRDFLLKPSLLRVAPGSEMLIVQPVFAQTLSLIP